jgi:DNA-binding NarL/FixJ family response regulator
VSGTQSIPEVALAGEEPLAGRIRSALGLRFRVVDATAAARAALRIFGPAELMRSGPRALERHRRRHPSLPFVVVLPPGAAAAFVRACLEAGAAEVVQSDQLELRLAPALEAAWRTRR